MANVYDYLALGKDHIGAWHDLKHLVRKAGKDLSFQRSELDDLLVVGTQLLDFSHPLDHSDHEGLEGIENKVQTKFRLSSRILQLDKLERGLMDEDLILQSADLLSIFGSDYLLLCFPMMIMNMASVLVQCLLRVDLSSDVFLVASI
eukprot:CAMPEP_0170546132 /NCGR_PEP_ID=MMETSP0211-20121228/4495_1 /TAXON_ID=311385 /ORGANISM="Pseudokeronopsis sp., Strain OXSARD2" /LENGTH=146 /DNA_ID=CAMNT_0010850423 /DNA_START=410 /DNA_END=847 /DNA_ORIENTATION=-